MALLQIMQSTLFTCMMLPDGIVYALLSQILTGAAHLFSVIQYMLPVAMTHRLLTILLVRLYINLFADVMESLTIMHVKHSIAMEFPFTLPVHVQIMATAQRQDRITIVFG